MKGETLPVLYARNYLVMYLHGRFLHGEMIVLNLVSCAGTKQFGRTLYNNCTRGE